MRARGRLLASLSLVLAIGLLVPALVRAATVQDLVTLAGQQGLSCNPPAGGEVFCSGSTRVPPTNRTALVRPETGQEQELETTVQPLQGETPLDSASIGFMSTMHTAACGASNGVDSFVQKVGALDKPGSVPDESIGTCLFSGAYMFPLEGSVPFYLVRSKYVEPPPPTQTPTPAPPTPEPTLKSTPKPPKPTHTPAPTEPTTAESPSPAPSAAPTATPTPAATATFQPTQEVAAATSVPEASPPPPAAPPPPPPPHPPTFADSVLAIDKVNSDAVAIGGSLAVALLLLLIIGFAGELFNNTVENNYSVVAAWFTRGPLGRLNGWLARHGRGSVLTFLALTALVSSFVDPTFGPDLHGLAEFLGFLVGLVVVLASFKLPPMLAHRRKTGELGRLRPLPWALAIAALFVLVSRIGNLQPGYLYGIVLGAIFVTEVSDKEEGRETFYGSLWTLAAAVLGWLGLTWVRTVGFAEDSFAVTLLATAFAAVLVAGLEATAFGLMPLKFMPGYTIYKWNRLGWAVLFGLSVFGFIHILIGPTSGYVSELSPAAFVAALGVFAAFGALSIGTWAYFRFRRPAEAT